MTKTLGLILVAALTSTTPHVTNLPKAQVDALSGIDVAITRPLIESAFDPQPLDDLIALAHTATEDPGVRLRAYRAMHLYQGTQARTALAADIAALSGPTSGVELLYLRAAIETLGLVGESADVPVLVPLLDFEPSRDIRAATADALREIGDTAAVDPLRDRLAMENVEQVRLAISRALRELPQTP